MKTLQLGCGVRPIEGAYNHDRTLHSPHIDLAFDLDVLPWQIDSEEFDKIIALDVMEHLRLDVQQWLDECWRILKPDGVLVLRLPAWDNPVSYRDPTHRRVFHPETFHYWDKTKQLWHDYGKYYFEESNRWWRVETVERANQGDLSFILRKQCE